MKKMVFVSCLISCFFFTTCTQIKRNTVVNDSSNLVAQDRPNIVVFLVDDMGWGDSGCYGNDLVKTPNIDKLATEGVRFTQSYSACGVCSPSRSSILTGRTPYRNGVFRHLSGVNKPYLRSSEITYPKLLKQAGYETCHVGKWHLNSKKQFNNPEFPQPNDHGYDYWMATHNNATPSHKNPSNFVRNGERVGELEGFSAPLVAEEALHWLTNIRDKNKPFVLSVWVHEPHKPIATDDVFMEPFGENKNREYLGNISQLDHSLGMLMQGLEELEVAENTFFMFTSDNGPEGKGHTKGGSTGGLRGRKRSDHEGGIRVPGIVRWPGKIKAGVVSDIPIIGSDIFATALDIAGVDLPIDRVIDGVSIVPAFSGQPLERKTPLFWRTHVSPPDNRVAMRIGDWKLIGNDEMNKFQLYKISEDWKEENNLAEQMPQKTAEMTTIMLATWKEIAAEGPSEWWLTEPLQPIHKKMGGVVAY